MVQGLALASLNREALLSVIVPTKDRAGTLASTLEALERQQDVDGGFEVVSRTKAGDDTPTSSAGRPRRRSWRWSRSRSAGRAAAACNAAVEAARGEVLLLLGTTPHRPPRTRSARMRHCTGEPRGAPTPAWAGSSGPARARDRFHALARPWRPQFHDWNSRPEARADRGRLRHSRTLLEEGRLQVQPQASRRGFRIRLRGLTSADGWRSGAATEEPPGSRGPHDPPDHAGPVPGADAGWQMAVLYNALSGQGHPNVKWGWAPAFTGLRVAARRRRASLGPAGDRPARANRSVPHRLRLRDRLRPRPRRRRPSSMPPLSTFFARSTRRADQPSHFAGQSPWFGRTPRSWSW